MTEGMPWGMILKRTAQVAVVTLVGLTWAAHAALKRQQDEERFRNRWTDANRWEH